MPTNNPTRDHFDPPSNLSVDFEDGNHKNFKIDNLRLLCPNCYLSYNGRFPSSKTFCK